MDSLMFYDAVCNRYATQKSGTDRERRTDLEKLVDLILKELETGDIKSSPFLAETDKIYGRIRTGGKAVAGQLRRRRPNLPDACEVAACVFSRLCGGGDLMPGDGRIGQGKVLLFAGSWMEAGFERRLAGLQKNMEGIKSCLKEKNIRKKDRKEGPGTEKAGIGDAPAPEDDFAYLRLKAEQECTERMKMRLEANQREAGEWHRSHKELIGTMSALQADIGREFKRLMCYSDDLTEKYVLRFARAMTEIYNLISDSYLFHTERVEQAESEDYYNAVLNYEEFMSSIADALAGFGVEEIVSVPGTAFDGKIHEVCDGSGDFSVHSAVVNRSVRPGFRYNDIVLQKERIQL